ncbi:MAG: glycerophosphoryl diester phosphodiesterase [Patiriisocius sp.]|jgi:glycerophosphoryl diester phosphodiesterase
MKSRIDWQGHRGSRGTMPENTIPSFITAIDHGVSTIELDVVLSGDGEVVVSHEPFFSSIISSPPHGGAIDSTNERSFNIYKMTMEEISKWDVGSKDHPVFKEQRKAFASKPTLKQTFLEVENHIQTNNLKPINYSIEIKCFEETERDFHPDPVTFTNKVIDEIMTAGMLDRTIIQAFDRRVINVVKSTNPKLKCSFLFQDDYKNIIEEIEKLEHKPDIFGPQYKLVDKKLVDYCHDKEIMVIPWTVNEKSSIIELISIGVDGIISDFTNWIDEFQSFFDEFEITIAPISI